MSPRHIPCTLGIGGLLLLTSAAATAATHTVAVISLADDPRYEARQLEKRYPGHPGGRLLDAAKVAAEEAKIELDMAGQQLKVREATAANAQDLPKLLQQLKNDKVVYWVLDLPAEQLATVQQQAAGALVFNASASRDDVRHCNNPMLHTYPSQAMLHDALAQYLAARSWRKVLLLQGANDATLAQAWQRAAKRYGLQLVENKTFKLSGDPRERDLANPRLLTNGRDHDVVAVADSQGEFARSLPYATQQPRPVVGSNGLVPLAWHPQWERYGGPQLNRRFMRQAQRPMTGQDWAAWMAVKSISTALTEQPKASATEQGKALRHGDITLDGFKGQPLSFRSWDGQLRQPIFLSHVDGVVGVAPVDGVLHPTEVLDTLGMEEKESPCKTKPLTPAFLPHLLRALRAVVGRELHKFLRQPARLASALVRPLLWFVVFAAGFHNVFGVAIIPPYETYIEYKVYMVPGLLGMIALFNGMQSSLSLVYDREMGLMRLLLTAPLARGWLLGFKLLAGTSLSLLQMLVFLCIAWAFGVEFEWSHLLSTLPILTLAATLLAALGLLLSVYVRQLENFAGAMNFVIFPMFFISPALYPLWKLEESGAVWLYQLARYNPFSHAVEAIRFALYGQFNTVSVGVLLGGSLLFFALALYGYDPQRGWIRQRGGA